MRGNAQHFQPQQSTAAAKSQLAMLLAGATDRALAAMTADSLAATHRVPFATCAIMLSDARGRRA